MAQGTEFIDRRNPNVKGRRATDSATGLGTIVGSVARRTGHAVARAAGTAAGIAAGAAALGGRPTVDASKEEAYWQEHYLHEPYYDPNYTFEDYLPAYRAGWEGRKRFPGRKFEEVERDLQTEYSWNRGESRLLWEDARQAMRAAWEHVA